MEMTTLPAVSIQPLDVILFRGVDPVSKAICFVEARKAGRGDFSHAGLAVTRDALDLPFLGVKSLKMLSSSCS